MELKSRLTLSEGENRRFVPCTVFFDFPEDIRKRGIKGRVDKNTITVTKPDGSFVHYNLSDDFLYEDKGRIHFLSENTAEREYLLSYRLLEGKGTPPPDYIGLVGNGDCLRTNGGEPRPFFNGMLGTSFCMADLDGDGRSELLAPQAYSFTKGREWHLVCAFRNLRTEKAPVWSDSIPLRCEKDGKIILIRGATCFTLADLDDDGLPELLTSGYGGYNSEHHGSEIYVHKNFGKKDVNGMPLFTYIGKISIETEFIASFAYVDLTGEGRKGFLIVHNPKTLQAEREEKLNFDCSEEEKAAAGWPRWHFEYRCSYFPIADLKEGIPAAGEPLELYCEGEPMRSGVWFQALCPFPEQPGGGGVLCTRSTSDFSGYGKNLYSTLEFLHYSGRRDKEGNLLMERVKIYENIRSRPVLSISWVNSGGFLGLIKTEQLAGLCAYLPLKGYEEGAPVFEEQQELLQANPYVNCQGGFASAALIDLDGGGDLDLITGSENGYSMIIENSGTQSRPRFERPRLLEMNKSPICFLNGPFDDPHALCECACGQGSPFYIDANFDGKPDVILKIGQRTYLFENLGGAEAPVLGPPRELRTENGAPLGMFRNRPAIGDFTGNGIPDVICDSPDHMRRLNLYRGYRDEEGRLCFHDGEALRYDDGSLISPIEWHRYTKFWNFGDYFGHGKKDILLSTCNLILVLENVGTNDHPFFKHPIEITDPDGGHFELGHHISMPIPVDWDGTGQHDLLICGESGLYYLMRQNYLNGFGGRLAVAVEPL